MSKSVTAQEAAAELHALINSRVASPRLEEIEGIIAKVATHKVGNFLHGCSAHRVEWDALVRQEDEASERTSAIAAGGGSYEAITAAEELCGAASDRLDACATRIFRTPARDPADIFLLAEACFRTLWSGCSLYGPDADELMADGPHHEVGSIDDACGEALAALFKGIRNLSGDASGVSVPDVTPLREATSAALPTISIKTLAIEKARACAVRDAFDEARAALWSQLKRGDPDGSLARRDTELVEHEHAAE